MRSVVQRFAVLVLGSLLGIPLSAEAGQTDCSYSKKLSAKEWSYSVSSRKGDGCNVQVLDISMQHKGKPAVKLRSDVDALACNAMVADVNNDSIPELLVVSKNGRKPGYNTAVLYRLDGTVLKQIPLPPLEEPKSYAGGDDFWIDGNQVVRSFPLLEGGRKTGIRTLKYEVLDNKLSLYVQTDEPVAATETTAAPDPVKIDVSKGAETTPSNNIPAPTISGVEVSENGILLKTVGSVGKYRIVRLDKPERIAVDFPGGKTELAGRSIPVGRFGITRVRAGNNKGFIRFVFDAKDKKFPAHTVKPVGEGVLVNFAGTMP